MLTHKERSYSQAIRTIQAMTNIDTRGYIWVIYLSCYLSQRDIKLNSHKYDYHLLTLKSINKNLSFWLKILPIPKANIAVIYHANLRNIYDFLLNVINIL